MELRCNLGLVSELDHIMLNKCQSTYNMLSASWMLINLVYYMNDKINIMHTLPILQKGCPIVAYITI